MTANPTTNDTILKLRQHGVEELASLLQENQGELLKLIERKTFALRPRVDSADILQETFLEASRRLEKYLERPAISPRLWLLQVTRQVIWRQFRSHVETEKRNVRRETESLDAPDVVTELHDSESREMTSCPESRLIFSETWAEVRQLLEKIPPVERQVLVLKQIEDLSFRQISCRLNITRSMTRRAYHRAIRQLRGMSAHIKQYTIS